MSQKQKRGTKRSAKSAQLDPEEEIDIVRVSDNNIRVVRENTNATNENSSESNHVTDLEAIKNYFDSRFNSLESKIEQDTHAVSLEFENKLASYEKISY